MEEGRVYTHGTLSAVRRRSDRAGTALSSEVAKYGPPSGGLERCLWKALERTVRASASLRVMVARALLGPLPGLPCGPKILQRDKKALTAWKVLS